MTTLLRLQLWPLRVLWIALALCASATAGDALDDRSGPVVASLAVTGWLGWGAALVALLVPRTLSLTVVRIVVPAGAVAEASEDNNVQGTTLEVGPAGPVVLVVDDDGAADAEDVYAGALRSLSQGRASFTATPRGLAFAPS